MIKNSYAVVGNGLDKQGKPYSKACKIICLKDNKGEYLSQKDIIYLDEIKPILTIVNTELKVV